MQELPAACTSLNRTLTCARERPSCSQSRGTHGHGMFSLSLALSRSSQPRNRNPTICPTPAPSPTPVPACALPYTPCLVWIELMGWDGMGWDGQGKDGTDKVNGQDRAGSGDSWGMGWILHEQKFSSPQPRNNKLQTDGHGSLFLFLYCPCLLFPIRPPIFLERILHSDRW